MKQRWIVGPKYDLFFFSGSVIFSWLFLWIYNLNPLPQSYNGSDITLTMIVIYFTFTALFDHPHAFQMVSRIYYDKVEFQRRRTLYTWGLAAFVLVGWAIVFFELENYWSYIYSTVGVLHILGQNMGFIKIYRSMSAQPRDISAKLELGAYFVLTGVAVMQYFKPTEQGQNLVWFTIKLPPVFFDHLITLGCLAAAMLVACCYWEIRNKNFSLPKWLFICAVLITDFVVFSQTQVPIIILVVLETAYHDIQYQGWTSFYQKKRFQKRHLAKIFFAFSIAYGLVIGALEFFAESGAQVFTYLFMPFTMFVFFHYCIDGKIWKVSTAPELKGIFKKTE